MNSCPRYPVKHCHFCNQIMLYNRYDNGENYAYCNNDTSCMGFNYDCHDNSIKIKIFTISDDMLHFRVTKEPTSNSLVIKPTDTSSDVLFNLFNIEPNIILDKEKSIKLMKKIRKTVLLMD